jgi:cell division septum initiation protein DivIVA
MTATLEQIIEALRNELQQYGEMLALLEAQQRAVSQREAGAVLTSIPAIEAQANVIQDARRARETRQRQLAWALGQPDSIAFQELLPLLPDEYRPLVSALVEEINELLGQVRQFAERNRSQLRCSLELMDRFLAAFSAPGGAAIPSQPDPSPRPVSTAVV